MEFLGIGAPELFFIIIIALILLGPKDMQKAGKTIGAWLNRVVRSDWWKAFRQTSEEIRRLPTNLMREANREMMDLERDVRASIETPSIAGPRGPLPTDPVETTPTIEPPSTITSDSEIPSEPETSRPSDHED